MRLISAIALHLQRRVQDGTHLRVRGLQQLFHGQALALHRAVQAPGPGVQGTAAERGKQPGPGDPTSRLDLDSMGDEPTRALMPHVASPSPAPTDGRADLPTRMIRADVLTSIARTPRRREEDATAVIRTAKDAESEVTHLEGPELVAPVSSGPAGPSRFGDLSAAAAAFLAELPPPARDDDEEDAEVVAP